jgi:ketosteroid isomerase-like protein
MNQALGQPRPVVLGAPSAGGSPALVERFAATPRLASEALCRALNNRDLEAALACFAPDAALVWSDGTLALGEGVLRERLYELIARAARIEVELLGVVVSGDLALAHEHWRIAYGGEVDPAAAPKPGPTMVLRLLAGEWRLAIAAPWGVPPAEPLMAIWP